MTLAICVGLAGAGRAEQSLEAVSGSQPLDKRADGLRLITRRLVVGDKLKTGHGDTPCETPCART